MSARPTSRLAVLAVGLVFAAPVAWGASPATPAARAPEFTQVLRPGQGALVRSFPSKSPRVQVVDPSEPVRVIVEFDAVPVATARLRALDAEAPLRMAARLRADLAAMSMRAGSPLRAEVRREYSQVFSGAALMLDRSLLPRVRALSYVRGVFPDDTVRTCDAVGNAVVGADRVRQQLGLTGEGVRIGIVDTGIDYDHPAFGGGFGPGHRVAGGWDFANDDPDPRDDHGHGTHVAGIAAGNGGGVEGAAPEATLYAFKVLNAGGYGWDSDILAAFERVLDPDENPATDDAMNVINCSFGASGGGPDWPTSVAIDHLTELGVVCVVAAGNEGTPFGIGAPGSAAKAITVGASDNQDLLAFFSSRGPVRGTLALKPDLVAPGYQVVSSVPGGGTAVMSGTSMATPLVAGVAAQILQLHPGWSPATLKAALVGASLGIGETAFAQGAGRMRAYEAAIATFVVTPTALSFGLDDAAAPTWVRDDTLHVTNLDASPKTVVIPPSTVLRPGAVLTTSYNSIAIGANATVAIPIRLTVDNSIVPYAPARPCGYDGALVVSSGGEFHRVPVTFHKGVPLELRADPAWDIGHWLATFFVFDESGTIAFEGPSSDSLVELVPPGRYGYIAGWYPFDLFVIKTGLEVSAPTTIAPTPADATVHVTFAHVDGDGAPLAGAATSLEMQYRRTGFSYGVLGFPVDHFDLSPLPLDFDVQWSRVASDYRSRWLSLAGNLTGISQSRVLSNRAADLKHFTMHFPAPPAQVPSVIPLLWDFHAFGTAGGYLGLGYAKDSDPPVTGPSSLEWWGDPQPGLEMANKGFAVDDYEWDGTVPFNLGGKQLARYGPRLGFENGWPIRTTPWVLFHTDAARFWGDRMNIGTTQPVWRGSFRNSWGTVQLYGDGQPWYGGLHFVSDAYGGVVLEPDPQATLSRAGAVLYSGPVQGAGDFSTWGPWTQNVGSGPVTFQTAVPYLVGAQPASLGVTASMNTDLSDSSPPSLDAFCLFSNGAATDTIDFSRSDDAGVRFRFLEQYAFYGGTLLIRQSGTVGWSPLPAAQDGDAFLGRLPPGRNGLQDVRLLSSDASGNSTNLEWVPAYFSKAAAEVSFRNASAMPSPDGIHVQWLVSNGAGLGFTVERQQDTTAWLAVGRAVADAGGGLAFVDTTAEAATTYRYRALLPRGGTPSYSASVAVSTSGAPALSFGRTGPNPLPDASLRVEFVLPVAGPARVGLYDIGGRRVAEVAMESLGAGPHEVTLALPADRSPGMYFLMLRQGNDSATRRVCVLR